MNQAIQICNYSYVYPDGTRALDAIHLTIEHGEKVSLIGPNGAGKSTLLLAVAGFIRGTGMIFIDGMELCSRNLRHIRSKLGCCLENPEDQLFMPTVFEDVIFGPLYMNLPPQQVKDNVDCAFDSVGLTALAEKAPYHLSAGQKKAVSFAAVFSMAPQIITCDKPDAGLDLQHRTRLQEAIVNSPRTHLIATSNLHFAAVISTRVIVMDNGRIVADGPAQSILSNKDMMETHGLEPL
ncbi:MAG: ATP-binding cassette domain-containing protein [Sedimentisphaerales bacterium]|nr:ATP-binding cassette domain-containing protein [Sedimentisphaerales bacterium]